MTTKSTDKLWLSGNEAMALGAYEAGVKVASGYPGTPSTEIMENLSKYEGVHTEWAPNEKVGLEVALGASFVGVRALATMKHVGMNVSAAAFMTLLSDPVDKLAEHIRCNAEVANMAGVTGKFLGPVWGSIAGALSLIAFYYIRRDFE